MFYPLAGLFRFSIIVIYCSKEGIIIYNPFLTEGVLQTDASINKLIIAKMPVCSVKQDLTGKSAQDIFSTKLFGQEIKKASSKLHIDVSSLEEKFLPLYLEDCLNSDEPQVKHAATSIMQLFGERLAVILLCLKEGTPKNRQARSDWTDEHWDYWNSLKKIIIVGGLASPPLGDHLLYYVNQVFTLSNKHPYEIILGKDSTYAGLRGCATYIDCRNDSMVNLIFDYGQSFIKRCYVRMLNEKLEDIVILDKELSKHAQWDVKDPVLEKSEADALDCHFIDTIIRTINEVEAAGQTIHPHIVLSIANYVKDGVLANRGGYGKLRLVAPNYASHLSSRLQEKCGRTFYFTMIHDGTAMAAGYSNYSHAVCLSMGTAFGVGFPDGSL